MSVTLIFAVIAVLLLVLVVGLALNRVRAARALAGGLAAIVDSSADAILSVSLDGTITSWNKGAERMYGYSASETVGRSLFALAPPERAELARELLTEVARGRQINHFETEPVRKDGARIHVSNSISPIRDERGRVVGASAIARDITERTEAERHFQPLLEAAPDAMVIVDETGKIELVNRQVEKLFGYSREELLGKSVEILVPERARGAHAGHRSNFMANPHTRAMGAGRELSLRRKDGSELPVEISLSPLETEHGLLITAAVRDVSDRRKAEQALAQSEELFRRSFEDSGVGMALIAIEGGELGRLLQVNQALASITGYSRERLTAMEPLAIVHPDEEPGVANDLQALLGAAPSVVRREARLIGAEGEPVWASLTASLVRDPAAEPAHVVLQVQDMSERKRFEGQLQHLADHDALTGLFNRRRFESELERERASAQRYGSGGAVLVLDLDHFKLVNDSLGHAVGDELITIVAQLLRRRLRESDILGRMGGDEFAVILPRANVEDARRVAESLLREIRTDTTAAATSVTRRVTASIGVAIFSDDGGGRMGAQELLAEADIAMYDAKEAGRDRVEVYDVQAARHERMRASLAWEERIKAAIDSGRFVLHAQPIMSLNGTREHRYELLLRMLGENGDPIPPGAFLYVAERANLVQRIDRWVVEQAAELLAEQHRLGRDVNFAVNLSAKSISDPQMADFIADAVTASGVNPAKLSFEVTETAAIVNIAQARAFAERLRQLGSTFVLDDFGAGFASFYYLKHLSFDYLKIDGEFIQELTGNHINQLVVRSVASIARGLGKRTIAEFVGDQPTIELLRDYGVDYAQGFFIGPPTLVSEVDFERPLLERVAG